LNHHGVEVIERIAGAVLCRWMRRRRQYLGGGLQWFAADALSVGGVVIGIEESTDSC